ncbi:MAG: hypothetical protein WC738_05255 [Candidatus Omnitrophota bacterium]|jgi:hypothetical protein
MKKYIIFVLIGMVVMTAIPAGAASVGNPKTQGEGKIATDIEWSYIFNRDLHFEDATRPSGHDADMPINFRITRGYNILGKIVYGLLNAMDIYVKLGIAKYDFRGDVFVGDTKKVEEQLSAENGFIYGGGFKLAYDFKNGWAVGCDAQYLTSDHKIDFNASTLSTGAVTVAEYYDCWIQEWHAAPYIAKKIGKITMYAGGRYSDLRLSQKHPNDSKRWDNLIFSADYKIGVFTGVDWNFGNSFKLNVEGRFVDELALSVCGECKF